MLDGIDWTHDRNWELAFFQKLNDGKEAKKMFDAAYPQFRVETTKPKRVKTGVIASQDGHFQGSRGGRR